MRPTNKIFTVCICALLFVLLAGCASSGNSSTSTSSEPESNTAKLKETAKDAWGAVGFAMNIANPMYYAKKAAKYGYEEIKDHDQE